MKILVEGIPAAGRDVELALRDGWAAEAAEVALDRAPTRLSGVISLKRASTKGVVLVGVRAEAVRAGSCDRCGEPCELVVRSEANLLYAPEEAGSAAYDGGEIELEVDDLDLGWYTGGELSLEDVLREALTLALPTRVTCTDTVGCDMRTDALLAATRPSESPFAVLGRLKSRPDPE